MLFSYFTKGSVAPILLWHTKRGNSVNFYHPDQTGTEEHAQFSSSSWQSHTLDPVAVGLMQRYTSSRTFTLRSAQPCSSEAGQECAQLQSPKIWGAGWGSSSTPPW